MLYRIYQTHIHSQKEGWATYVKSLKEFAEVLMEHFDENDNYLIIHGCLYEDDQVEFDDNDNYVIYREDDPVIDPAHPKESYCIGDHRYTIELAE